MKFFVTENGDIAYQLTHATERLGREYRHGDALLVVTKRIDLPAVRNLCIEYKRCTIVHANITGLGGSEYERGVAEPVECIQALYDLMDAGFPPEQIVLRVDPIIPTEIGVETAMRVITACPLAIRRIRISFIDNYNRMKAKMQLPWDTFHAPEHMQKRALDIITSFTDDMGYQLEACGEPQLGINKGCISLTDFDILGLPHPNRIERKGQRPGCNCLREKTELLIKQLRCPNGCYYCYYGLGG